MTSPPRSPPPWATSESSATETFSRPSSGSVMTGIWSGPMTSGCKMRPGWPVSMGEFAHLAVASSKVITTSATGHWSRVRADAM